MLQTLQCLTQWKYERYSLITFVVSWCNAVCQSGRSDHEAKQVVQLALRIGFRHHSMPQAVVQKHPSQNLTYILHFLTRRDWDENSTADALLAYVTFVRVSENAQDTRRRDPTRRRPCPDSPPHDCYALCRGSCRFQRVWTTWHRSVGLSDSQTRFYPRLNFDYLAFLFILEYLRPRLGRFVVAVIPSGQLHEDLINPHAWGPAGGEDGCYAAF